MGIAPSMPAPGQRVSMGSSARFERAETDLPRRLGVTIVM